MGTVPFAFDESERPLARAALDVLCWVLNHEHADGFTRTLATVEGMLTALGYHLKEIPK